MFLFTSSQYIIWRSTEGKMQNTLLIHDKC